MNKKIRTTYNQCVHRIRLRPIVSNHEIEDITKSPKDFKPDTSLGIYRSVHEFFDKTLKNSLKIDIIVIHDILMIKSNQTEEVQHRLCGVIATTARQSSQYLLEPRSQLHLI